MRTCFSIDPLTIDPRKNGDHITSTFLSLLYEGLTRIDPNGEIQLALAESIDLSADKRTIRFHLRDAKWSDGRPVTAHDFEYSWKKILTPSFASPCPYLFYSIRNAEEAVKGEIPLDEVGIKALDERTLQVELENPTPYFLSLVAFCNFYPIPKHVETENPCWENRTASQLICSGPFKLAHWNKKQEIVCEKNPLYWNADQVTLKSIHISINNNPYSVLQLFDQDEIDLASVALCSLPVDVLERYRHDGTLKIFSSGGTAFCSFNIHQYPFHNKNIRKAFSFAIDREYIVMNITLLDEIPASRCLPPCLVQNETEPLFPSFNIPLARKYLNEGFKELGIAEKENDLNIRLFLNNLNLTYVSTPLNRKIVEALQEQWKKALGFNVTLKSCDFHSFIQGFNKRNYSMGLASWVAQFNDPMSIFERFKSKSLLKNFPGYESPQFNELLDRSSRNANPKERRKILNQAEAQFLEDMPITPIYHFNHAFLSKSYVTGLQINALGGFHFNRCRTVSSSEHQIAVI